MPSGDKAKFCQLDELAECDEEDEEQVGGVDRADECDDERAGDASKAQDMVDQLCDKITLKQKADRPVKSNRIPWKIYISRAMTAWGDRLWSFGAGIFMNLLAPENLRLVAIYGFATSVSVIVFGAVIGAWIDRTSRLTAAKTFLVIQNLIVAICCSILATFFWFDGMSSWPEVFLTVVPVVVILLAVVADLASIGSRIAVEKDWIVVIANNDNDQLVAPSLAGIIFDFLGNEWAAIFIAMWNLSSVIFEYFLLTSIYQEFPGLGSKKTFETNSESELTASCSICSLPKYIWTSVTNSLKAWLAYMRHPARDAGLGLAFLYMTVLGFDNITYGYCLRQCVTESIIGGLVAVSAVFGVLGSLTFPLFRRCVGLNKTGLIGMASLVATLSMCVASIWIEGSPFDIDYFKEKTNSTEIESHEYGSADSECYVSSFASVGLFLAGVIAARFGLWMSDLVRIC